MKAHKDELVLLNEFPKSWVKDGVTYPRKWLDDMTTNDLESWGWYDVIDNIPTLTDNQQISKDVLIFNCSSITQNYTITPRLSTADYLLEVKTLKAQQVKAEFIIQADLPATDSNAVVWQGGWDSSMKLDAAKRLSEAAGSSVVKFFDYANTAHVLTIPDAMQVVLAVAGQYQTLLGKKQDYYLAIGNATTVAQVEAINIDWGT